MLGGGYGLSPGSGSSPALTPTAFRQGFLKTLLGERVIGNVLLDLHLTGWW